MSIRNRWLPMSLAVLLVFLALPAVAQEESLRTVTVSGVGEVLAAPDRAHIRFGVEVRGEDLDELHATADRVIGEFLDLAAQLNIEPQHVRAAGVQIRPEYRWDQDSGETRFVGYYVARPIHVDLRDLTRLGELISGAVRVGINQIAEPVLEAGNREELRRQALALAAEDARDNAQVLAEALGAELGAVRAIHSVESGGAPPQPLAAFDMARSVESVAAEGRYEVGEIRFRAQAVVQFDLQ